MENIIYCFSGRGNSLSIAQGLAERIEGARVLPMSRDKGEVAVKGGTLGLVLPVIDFGLPLYVRNFVGRLRCDGDKPFVYAIITCGGIPGASMRALEKLLWQRGLALAAGEYAVFRTKMMPDEDWKNLLDAIATTVRAKAVSELPKPSIAQRVMTGLLNPLARWMIPGEDRKFRVSESCNGCGVCQRICPARNIKIINGKPEWLHHCEQCAACFSWCPQEAISGKCLAARTHYRNSRIQEGDMLGE
jgi:formate hydrogenlyase subunit 6/NADH:ubiquinone oxidoreductase subunit I